MNEATDNTYAIDDVVSTDVLIVGSGIAGTSAAIAAAHARPNTQVTMACAGAVFGGSSFTGTTWGLGMIGPKDDADAERLTARILEMGCGAADEGLVRSFVGGIRPAIEHAQAWGMRFREPSAEAAKEREYIACFDNAHRAWFGLERDGWRQAAAAEMQRLGVQTMTHAELMDILVTDGRVTGAVLFDGASRRFRTVSCGAIVLASGGAASLWPQSLSPTNQATAHALATRAGATCVNLEFMQFMPTIVDPPVNVVFNEKMFRYMEPVGDAPGVTRELLDMRAGYGPFSASFDSRAVDVAISQAGPVGLAFAPLPLDHTPEFVDTYFAWLEGACGVNATSTVRIAHRAQASNGGIAIDEHGFTGVSGLYAAGETTGGMHGANRLGGLASVCAMVFGERAGQAAAEEARKPEEIAEVDTPWMHEAGNWEAAEAVMQAALDTHCGVHRTTAGLETATTALAKAKDALVNSMAPTDDPTQAARSRRTLLRLETAGHVVAAMGARKQSAGSHHRA